MTDNAMTNNKPYLIRAMHEWVCDNGCTPYLYVDTQVGGLRLPEHLLAEKPLILNASPNACKDLDLADEAVSFQARFGGEVCDVYLPTASIIAVIARENGQGMTFEMNTFFDQPDEELEQVEQLEQISQEGESDKPDDPPKKKGLKIIR